MLHERSSTYAACLLTFAVGSSPDGADLGTFTVNASQSSNSAWGTYIFPRDAFAEGDIVHTSVTCANARGQTTASCGGAVIDGLPPQSGSLALQGAKWDDRTEAWHLPEPGSARLEWQGFADAGTGIAGYLLCVGAASSGCERWVANFSGANRWARVPLEAGESYLTLWAEDGQCTLRLLHYPPVDVSSVPEDYWRAGPHTDRGRCISFLCTLRLGFLFS